MIEQAMVEEFREKERLAQQFVIRPYAEVKETLDEIARESAKRSAVEFAERCVREAAA